VSSGIISTGKVKYILFVIAGFLLTFFIERLGLVSGYVQLVTIYVGINIMLCLSLNLVNGYMGEFSVGHAGFMAVGAYASALFTVKFFPAGTSPAFFLVAVMFGGAAAALAAVIVAVPSFKTRGDYLAIVTLAFNMIVKSAFENIEYAGAARGMLGIAKFTTLPWVFAWVVFCVWITRNFIYSGFGRGMAAIREDEIAAAAAGVDTRGVKMMVFVVSSFFAGAAGGLYAHVLQFINPAMFDVAKSTEILVMVYLGGTASIGGSIIGATAYTVLLEALRPLGLWRMVVMPLMLILLMLFRPGGIMGGREFGFFTPKGGA
jgi:branched-chain amino acid transport system permease protein